MSKDNIVSRIIDTGGKLSVKSALNPVLWLCAIITMPSLIFSTLIQPVPSWLIYLILLPVITTVIGFLFLLIFDRDKLQSS